MKDTFKSKAKSGLLWSTIERLSVQLLQFAIGVILARLLSPSDFGLLGILTIFFTISQTFVDSGLDAALVQKNNRTDKDYSTVFVFNLLMSTGVYLILYFSAPLISNFFNNQQLTLLTRVVSLSIIIRAFALVQRTRLIINLDFKTIARVNFLATLAGGIISIYSAYIGFGVWALVIQQIVTSTLSTILFWIMSKWKISFLFYKESFKELFGYGSKLLIAGLYAQLLNNIYNVVIGKKFSITDLGYYTKSQLFTNLSSETIAGIIQQVTFPLLASVNNDKKKILAISSRAIQLTSFLVVPLMTLFALLAEPIISILLGEKWMGVVPLLQWMVFTKIFYPISAINMNILKSLGRSDLFLKLDLSKFPFFLITLLITIPLGIKAMIIGQVLFSFIAFLMNAYLTGRLIGYGAIDQLKDIFPTILTTVFMAVIVFFSINYIEKGVFKIFIGGFTALVSFLSISFLIKSKSLTYIYNELKTKN